MQSRRQARPVRFSDSEKEFMTKNHKTMSSIEMAVVLGRTYQSIYTWCNSHDCPPVRAYRKTHWTDEDIKAVRDLFPDHSPEYIGSVLNRSAASVNNMAHKLAVYHSREYINRNCSAAAYKRIEKYGRPKGRTTGKPVVIVDEKTKTVTHSFPTAKVAAATMGFPLSSLEVAARFKNHYRRLPGMKVMYLDDYLKQI